MIIDIPGESLNLFLQNAVQQAKDLGREIRVKFRQIELNVHPNSWEYDLETIYCLKKRIEEMKRW